MSTLDDNHVDMHHNICVTCMVFQINYLSVSIVFFLRIQHDLTLKVCHKIKQRYTANNDDRVKIQQYLSLSIKRKTTIAPYFRIPAELLQYFRPVTLVLILQQCCHQGYWYFHKILSSIRTKVWLVHKTTSLHCNTVCKTKI